MKELTIILDSWGHNELEDYLLSLNGILDVTIKIEEVLEIYIQYDFTLITQKMIKYEILLFLDILKMPSILAFDKRSDVETLEYKILRDDICCEYCLEGAIDDLFEIDGIEKVESNFNKTNYYKKENDKRENIIININYNKDLINIEDMKLIESKLNI